MALKAIFLDAGGTLIHVDRRFLLDTLAGHGVRCTEEQLLDAQAAGAARVSDLLRGDDAGDDALRWRVYLQTVLHHVGCTGERAEAVGRAIRRRHEQGKLWTSITPGTREALEELKRRGYTVGVVSNADGRVESFLRHSGLRDPLDFVVDSGRVGVEKPDPRIFHIACQEAGVAPDEAVHVGDIYEIDVLGARRAGVEAILLDPDDRSADADCHRLRSVTELPAWLDGAAAPNAGADETRGSG